MSPRREGVAWATVSVLAAATVFETLVALEVVPVGKVPGDGARGGGVVLAAALLAMLVGAAVALVAALAPPATDAPSLAQVLLAPSGVAYLTARWLTFDPYYLPTLRRYSDGGVGVPWIAALVVAGTVAGLLTRRLPRLGAVATSGVLTVSALTAWALGFGK